MVQTPANPPAAVGSSSKVGSTGEGTAVVLRLPPTGQTDKALVKEIEPQSPLRLLV